MKRLILTSGFLMAFTAFTVFFAKSPRELAAEQLPKTTVVASGDYAGGCLFCEDGAVLCAGIRNT